MPFPENHDDPDMRDMRVMVASLTERINKCVQENKHAAAHAYKLKWDLDYMIRVVDKWIYGNR